MSGEWRVAAVGDAIVGTRISQYDHPGDSRFAALSALVRDADVASVNLETSLFDLGSFRGWPAAERGGSYLLGPPAVADDLAAMGFDLFARANNHAGDWGIEGLIATSAVLDARGLSHSGVGMNLSQAARPTYIDAPQGRVAMVSFTTTFPTSSKAAAQRSDIVGRPGCNGITVERQLRLPPDTFSLLTGVLDSHGDPQLFKKAGLPLTEGDEPGVVESLKASDVERVLGEIEKAAAFADLVLVNGHTHEPANHVTEPPPWLEDLARRCIEAGAQAFLGHGPHQLRGMEIHLDRPIFYSLGNFVFHREVQDPQPAEQYEVFGLDPSGAAPHHYLAARDASRHLLSMTGPVYYESVVAMLTFRDGRFLGVSLHPIELAREAAPGSRGTPRLAPVEHGEEILARLAGLSKAYGLDLTVEEGIGHWQAE